MAEVKKKQTMRYSDQELAIIKGVFSENDPLIFAIRKSMLQFELTPEEKELLKLIKDDSLKILKKTFLPELEADAPLFQLVDSTFLLGIDIKDKDDSTSYKLLRTRQIQIDYLEQQFTVFTNELPETSINLKILGDFSYDLLGSSPSFEVAIHDLIVNVMARNSIIYHVDSCLNQLEHLSGLRNETVDETIARLQKNSSK